MPELWWSLRGCLGERRGGGLQPPCLFLQDVPSSRFARLPPRLPAGAVVAFDETFGLRAVGGAHVGAVPFHFHALADAEGDAAEEDDFGEIAGDFEV